LGEGLALDAAWLFVALLVVLVVIAAGIASRRFVLERRGATIECGLRRPGGPWRLGLASYQLDEFCWYRIFGLSPRPEHTFPRHDLTVVSRRAATQAEELALGPGRIVVECRLGAHREADTADSPSAVGASSAAGVPPAAASSAAASSAAGAAGLLELALAESVLTGLLAWLEAAPRFPPSGRP
jgi:Protein of unknown function (DUF2550)